MESDPDDDGSDDSDFDDAQLRTGGSVASGIAAMADPQLIKEAMDVIETMVMHAIENGVESIGCVWLEAALRRRSACNLSWAVWRRP